MRTLSTLEYRVIGGFGIIGEGGFETFQKINNKGGFE